MKRYRILFLLLLLLLFLPFLSLTPLAGGDFAYVFPETSSQFPLLPSVYRSYLGLGQNSLIIGGIELYFQLTSRLFTHIPWAITERIFWIFPIILLSAFSSYKMTKSLLGMLIYTTNTYLLMILGGGQMGVALAYSIVPLVFAGILNNFTTVQLGLIFGLLLFYDLRIYYVTTVAVAVYILLFLIQIQFHSVKKARSIVYSNIIAVLLNSFWLLPLALSGSSATQGFGQEHTNPLTVSFFSFAHFSDAFGLLHPNWPENIFGKVYFMRPEFLLLPFFAFFSLLFVKDEKNLSSRFNVLFFALSGLIGVFLTKGVNEPFGQVYKLFFSYIPGFIMFRDPTKFYVLISLSYTFLIPYSLYKFSRLLRNEMYIVSIGFVLVWLLLIHQLWTQQLTGIFAPKEVPSNYRNLKNFLYHQPEFFRTLWIPQKDIFTFTSSVHPSLDAAGIFSVSSTSAVLDILKKQNAEKQLQRWSVKYIIVPEDTEKKLFVKDRKYNDEERQKVIASLEQISWLHKVTNNEITGSSIFEVRHFKDHFWTEQSSRLSWSQISPTYYSITLDTKVPTTLFFSEQFDRHWTATIDNKTIHALPTSNHVIQFHIDQPVQKRISIKYDLQKYMYIGFIISIFILAICSIIMIHSHFAIDEQKKKYYSNMSR